MDDFKPDDFSPDTETDDFKADDFSPDQQNPLQQKPQSFGQTLLDQTSNAIANTPLGMAAKGANAINEGFGKVLDSTSIPVSNSVQKGAQSLFRPFRAAGVGGMESAAMQPPAYAASRALAALKPNYEPQEPIEKVGAAIGENAPVIAASILSPSLAGPMAMIAQQAQTGKVSPLPAAMPIAIPTLKGAKWSAKKLFSASTGVSEPAMKSYLKNPNAIKEAPPVEDIAQKFPQGLNSLQKEIVNGDKAAWQTLRTSYLPEEGAIAKENVMGLIKKAKNDLKVYGGGVVGRASKNAVSILDSIGDDIQSVGKNVGGLMNKPGDKATHLVGPNGEDIYRSLAVKKNTHLPEATVKGIIQSLDDNINWEDATAQPVNSTLENLRTLLDKQLKNGNSAYQKAMEPVSENMRILSDAKRRFGIKNVVGEGLAPGTSTESSLSNALGKNKSETQRILKSVGDKTGQDYLEQLQNAKYAEEFKPGMRAQGSRRTLFGTAVGSGIGHFTGSPTLGGMAGAAAGFMMDTQGGPIAAKVLDVISKVPGIDYTTLKRIQSALPVAFQKPIDLTNENYGNSTQDNGEKQNFSPRSILKDMKPIPRILPSATPFFMGKGDISGDQPLNAEEFIQTRNLTKEKAREFLLEAKGNKDLARKLAKESGYSW